VPAKRGRWRLRHRRSATTASSGPSEAAPELGDELIDHGFLEGRCEVGATCPAPPGPELLAAVENRRLSPREGEVEARGQRCIANRHLERLRVAPLGLFLDQRGRPYNRDRAGGPTCRSLAGRVGEGRAEGSRGPSCVATPRRAGCARLRRPGIEGGLDGSSGSRKVGGDGALQVIDRDQRQPARGGDRLRGRETPRPERPRSAPARPSPRPSRCHPGSPPASFSAASTTGAASSRCWRAATSGTTPPKPALGVRPARRSRWRGSARRRGRRRRCRRRRSLWQGARRSPQSIWAGPLQSIHMISASSPLSW